MRSTSPGGYSIEEVRGRMAQARGRGHDRRPPQIRTAFPVSHSQWTFRLPTQMKNDGNQSQPPCLTHDGKNGSFLGEGGAG